MIISHSFTLFELAILVDIDWTLDSGAICWCLIIECWQFPFNCCEFTIKFPFQLLEANELNDDVQTIEMSQVSTDEMQMLLEVVYNGVVEATIEDLRKLILLAHRLYIAIPLSNELMQGLELKLPPRSPFRKPLMPKFTNGIPSGILSSATSSTPRSMLSSSLKSMFNGSVFSNNSHNSMTPVRPPGSMGSTAAAKENAAFAKANTPKLNIDPTTMTTILAHSQNNEHVCPICNSKYR